MIPNTTQMVLLVEDSTDDQELAWMAFAESDDHVDLHIVHDGEDAIEFLEYRGRHAQRRRRTPDLVLLDLHLPRRDGIEVARHLRATSALAYVPVVMLTTSGDPDDVRRAYDAGVNSYILKPVDFPGFLDMVRQVQRYWLHLNRVVG